MNKLISMVEFVLTDRHTATGHTNYAKLLSQKLELWMLVPCDEKNVPMQEPEHYELWRKYGSFSQYGERLTSVCEPYFKAKERVLFGGFEYRWWDEQRTILDLYLEDSKFYFYYVTEGFFASNRNNIEAPKTIENLIPFSLKLTPTAQKMIGL